MTAPLTSPVVKPEVNEFDDPMVEAADTACYGWTVMLAFKFTFYQLAWLYLFRCFVFSLTKIDGKSKFVSKHTCEFAEMAEIPAAAADAALPRIKLETAKREKGRAKF